MLRRLEKPLRLEPRWPVALTILAVLVLLTVLPDRIRLLPQWFGYIVGIVVSTPVVAIAAGATKGPWLRIERAAIFVFFLFMAWYAIADLTNLVGAIIERPKDVSGVQLLSSSLAVWVVNVLMFALLDWQIDRGGPEDRVNDAGKALDWLFPQETAPAGAIAAGWKPSFVDYLYLAYSTATAFSTTDVLPVTARAKLLMMLESAFSLMTIVVVASRAINILGT